MLLENCVYEFGKELDCVSTEMALCCGYCSAPIITFVGQAIECSAFLD